MDISFNNNDLNDRIQKSTLRKAGAASIEVTNPLTRNNKTDSPLFKEKLNHLKAITQYSKSGSNFKNILLDTKLGPIKKALPANSFPLGAMHEFISSSAEDAAATTGFVSALTGTLMQNNGVAIWIGSGQTIFVPALFSFGISPERIIFIDLKKDKEILWAMEEALKCEGIAAVVGQIPELGFTASRRLQLAVEESRVTGFVLRHNPRSLNTTACVTRWKINALPSESADDMPGIGFPRWNVNLLKVRNGKPGSWEVEYNAARFRFFDKVAPIVHQQKKAG